MRKALNIVAGGVGLVAACAVGIVGLALVGFCIVCTLPVAGNLD